VKPEDVGQKHTEPKEPPADPKPSALMKQLECMK